MARLIFVRHNWGYASERERKPRWKPVFARFGVMPGPFGAVFAVQSVVKTVLSGWLEQV